MNFQAGGFRRGRLSRGSALWVVSSSGNRGAVVFSRTCFSLSRRAELAQAFSGQAKACPTKDSSPLAADLPWFAGWRAEARRRLKSAPQLRVQS